MKKMFFIPMLTENFIIENKDFKNAGLEKNVGPIIFLQCNNKGETQDLLKIKKIWAPLQIINRFNEGRPTKIFPAKKYFAKTCRDVFKKNTFIFLKKGAAPSFSKDGQERLIGRISDFAVDPKGLDPIVVFNQKPGSYNEFLIRDVQDDLIYIETWYDNGE